MAKGSPFCHDRGLHLAPDGRRVADAEPRVSTDNRLPAQGYRLRISDDGVDLAVADDDGRRYGEATLAQLRHRTNAVAGEPTRAAGRGPAVHASNATLAACTILDWPDHPVRGVMLDVSRDKVPTLHTLQVLVDRLAAFKVNHLQLYMEHTFAYAGHEEVWRDADPYTAADLEALRRHCEGRGVELACNQNTLGHFERWLRHDRYRPLAIAPDGFDWLFGIRRPPLTLDPAKDGSSDLVGDLLTQLVGALDSRRVHVGMDEPWELPPERVPEWGTWLTRLRALPALDGRELLVWGDVPAAHPDLLAGIDDGVTVCEWGYEAWHPFDRRCAALAGAAVPFWVCPGTSSWMSIGGRLEDMLGNVKAAAAAGVSSGAAGFLVTDWGDDGHHQYLPVSEPGLAVSAALSWCHDANQDLDAPSLAALLDRLVFCDPAGATGHALSTLAGLNRLVTPRPPNMSPLVMHLLLPQWPVGAGFSAGMTPAELDTVDAAIDQARSLLRHASPERADGALVLDELSATADWLSLGTRDARLRLAGEGTLGSIAAADRAVLAERAAALAEEHARLWTARNRRGGLCDSLAWLEHLRSCYTTGSADPGWFGPFG